MPRSRGYPSARAERAVPMREQQVTYTSFQRPAVITENGFNAAFTYNAAGDRVKMLVKQNNNVILSRYYIGKQYELDVENNIERLYLGGDAYSAPAVYVKENNVWKIYYICRDYLGSITHIANILDLYEKNELCKRDKEDVDLIRIVMNYNCITFSSVKDLNVNMIVKFLSLREKIIYPKVVSIVENTDKLSHWIDFARKWKAQWFDRNAIMADNIKKFAKECKNKRIVVLVGLEHKPGLLDLLKSDSADYIIREYWTFR